jgi:hypothetical protein
MSGSSFLKLFQLFITSPQQKQKFSILQKQLPLVAFFAARKSICFYFTGFSLQSGLFKTPVFVVAIFF